MLLGNLKGHPIHHSIQYPFPSFLSDAPLFSLTTVYIVDILLLYPPFPDLVGL